MNISTAANQIGTGALNVLPDQRPLDLHNVGLYVADKHRNQLRKDGTPYINHIRSVGQLAGEYAAEYYGAASPHIATCHAAGLLHDTMEDQAADFEVIEAVANQEVATIVSWLSEDKRLPEGPRHLAYCARIAEAPFLAQLVKTADLADNLADALTNTKTTLPLWSFLADWCRRAKEMAGALQFPIGKLRQVTIKIGELEQAIAESRKHP